ncbi:MAG: PAS domain-containing protein [Armatimonadetes bacterium]|nr:PAS domain-containing protein [Armatimonadota bacterium]
MTLSRNLIKKFRVGFAVLIAILVVLVASTLMSFAQLAEANRWNIHTYKVLVETHSIARSLSNMEAGARGFAVTGDSRFLPRLIQARAEFSRGFNAAQALIKDEQSAALQRRLLRQQQQWVKVFVEPMVAIRQDPQNPAATLAEIRRVSIEGKTHVDGIRQTLADINDRELVLLRQRGQRAARLQTWTAAILLAGGAFAIALTATLCVMLFGNMRRLTQSNAQLAQEVAERTEAEAALRESAERLALVSEVSQMGDWDLNLATREAHRSPRHDQIFGYPAMLPQWNYDIFLQHVHPDDRAVVDRAFQKAIAHSSDWDFECRIVWSDASVHWIWGRGRVFQTGAQEQKRMIGTVADITERKLAQQETHALSMRLVEASHINRRIMEYSLDVICTIDGTGCFVQVSAASEKVWGYKSHELVGRPYIELVAPEDVAMTNEVAAEILAGRSTNNFENRYIHKNGALVPMVWSARWSEADGIMFCVARDVTARKQSDLALEGARDEAERAREVAQQAQKEAERANLAKSEFLSRMSHELRTPLNAILGFGQLLEMEELEDGQRAGVEQILKGGRHLLELVNEILDIASIDAGRLALSPEPVHLGALAEETMKLLRPVAAERRIRFENLLGGGYVLADQQRLKQVLLNLISNAVKYNREGGLVRLTSGVPTLPGRVRFEVTDTGSGILPAGLEKLFAPFERLDAAQKGVEGTGIGLTISQRLVQLMDGEIGVYSVAGEGTTFWVELPGAQDPMEAVERRNAPRPPAAVTEAPKDATHTILYMEDNLSNLNLIEHILSRRAQFRLLSAMQGRRGLELAREHCPDLILLDLHLPDINGDEVLRHLRAEPATRDIPVIILSADATPKQIERLLEMGAGAYLTKPLDVKKFLAVLDGTLNQGDSFHAR